MAKRQTNVEFITRLMERSQCGALMQAFVIDALSKAADAMVEAGPEAWEGGFVSAAAWYRCAKEAQDALQARLDAGA